MDSLKRNIIPSLSHMEDYLKKNKYQENISDFDTFWQLYKKSSTRKNPLLLMSWLKNAGFAAVSLAAVLLVIAGISQVSRLQSHSGGNDVAWNNISGNGIVIGGNNGGWQALKNSNRLSDGTKIRSDGFSKADLTINRTIRLKIYPSSEVMFGSGPGRSSFRLAIGKLAYVSGKLKKDRSVNVTTPLLNIEVTGTRFVVTVNSNNDSFVSVSEGKVRITPLEPFLRPGRISEKLIRELTARVIDKAGVFVSKSVGMNAKDQAKFYMESAELILSNSTDINKGNTGPYADRIAVLFQDLVVKKARFLETRTMDRKELSALSGEHLTEKVLFRVAADKKMDVTGKESEILDLPGGRQCFTVDRNIVFLSQAGDIEKIIAVGDKKISLTRPQLAGDLIVMGSDGGVLYAFDMQGMPVWTKKDSGIQTFNAYPVICGKKIAVPTMDKGLRFFDRNGVIVPTILDGRNDGLFSSPMSLQNGSIVLFGNEKGDFTAFDPGNNTILWKKNLIQNVSVFALTGGMQSAVILSRKSGETVAVRPSDGTLIWVRDMKQAAMTRVNPEADENRVAISGDQEVFILDILNGKTLARKTFPSRIVSMKWFRDKLLLGDESGQIYYFDSTGDAKEVYKTEGPVTRISVRGKTVTFFSKHSLVRLLEIVQES